MGNIGAGELIIALIIVLVLFGAKRLPEAARGLGQALKIFKTEVQRPPDGGKNGPEPITHRQPDDEQRRPGDG
jgi:sec-independent protein translocase protein TatA